MWLRRPDPAVRTAILLLSYAAMMAASPSHAADCRGAVQPLLRSLEPDPAGIAAARAVCEREADQGDADALYHLSLFDLGLAGWDPDAAIPGIRSAAAAGIPEAQYWLAWQYEAGPLLDHDQRLALEWYQAAAAREHRLALQRLAEAYDTGAMGLPVDPRQAADFRARAERCARREQG